MFSDTVMSLKLNLICVGFVRIHYYVLKIDLIHYLCTYRYSTHLTSLCSSDTPDRDYPPLDEKFKNKWG